MKWLLICFLILQVGIDLAHTVTAFPFVHYGMFSESFDKPDSILVYEVTENGKLLNPSDFRVYRWDMVQGPLVDFQKEKLIHDQDMKTNGGTPGDIKYQQIYYQIIPRRSDNSDSVSNGFSKWYKSYLSRLLGHPVNRLKIDVAWYRYSRGQIRLVRKITILNC